MKNLKTFEEMSDSVNKVSTNIWTVIPFFGKGENREVQEGDVKSFTSTDDAQNYYNQLRYEHEHVLIVPSFLIYTNPPESKPYQGEI